MVSYMHVSRKKNGVIVLGPCTVIATGVWRAMAWFPVGRTAVARGYAVTSSDGKVVRGYLNP